MGDGVMVGLPAAQLLRVVDQVLEDTSPFAGEARFVADEILRLRDAGQLSRNLAGDLGTLIYQRRMHSEHSGDFESTMPIRQLEGEINQDKRTVCPILRSTQWKSSPGLRTSPRASILKSQRAKSTMSWQSF